MNDLKWIKITIDIFDDEKIKLIESLPEADTIIVIWFKLLTLAGKKNDNGLVYITRDIPYTEEMLSSIINRPINTVRLALKTFKDFGMIDVIDNFITLVNWDKHQATDKLEKIKEQNRLRVANHREKQKNVIKEIIDNKKVDNSVTLQPKDNVMIEPLPVTLRNAIELDKELELDKENKDILSSELDPNPVDEVIKCLNQQTKKTYRADNKKTKSLIYARLKDGFTVEDFKKVIAIKCNEWLPDKKMNLYLRPETLFGNKFESYLNQDTGQTEHQYMKDIDLEVVI